MLLTKKEFVEEVAKRTMLTPYVVDELYNVSSGLVAEKLISGESVDVPKLGKFKLSERKASVYKNLIGRQEKTMDVIKYPTFTISNPLKNRIKNGQKYNKIS